MTVERGVVRVLKASFAFADSLAHAKPVFFPLSAVVGDWVLSVGSSVEMSVVVDATGRAAARRCRQRRRRGRCS